MTQILAGIWQNAPVWVWPLFFVLLAIGLLAMRPRRSSIIPFFFYPLFGFTAANAIGGLAHMPLNWILFALGYGVGIALAFRWQDRIIVEKQGRTLWLRGEKLTLFVLMTIFFSNFVNGVLNAVAPELQTAPLFTVLFALVIGACSGSFVGRALRVVTLGNRPGP